MTYKTCMVHRCEKCPRTISMWIPWNTLGWWLCIRSLFTTKKTISLLRNYSVVFSHDLEHDTGFRFEMQRKLVQIPKKKVPIVTEVDFFLTDVQNYKNMWNLGRHKDDFGIDATWVLFATSHGKSPCDGIGGTVKRLTARASLQRPYSDQILDVSSMLAFCKTNIPGHTVLLYFNWKNERSLTWIEKIKICLGSDYTRDKKLPFHKTSKFQCI